ncbi:hypothetical protein CPAR01_00331 [Colletotrichum paranaense]|uniref:Uncharacterized protein n=1 Tax=Colletotrichum paranaense TaxID=1914294 RepID=A0ABQ9T3L3_9PEZI|nr:uncharacterized protein CPAR01_00331 [Colletotrichum paranaense]KAK1546364.1 hypothetical protein CPAR01_00331 [Colletotrichum paranaense]
MSPAPDFKRWPRAVRMKRWLDWAKSQKLPVFRQYPDKSARVDKELKAVFWDFDRTDLPLLTEQECWERMYSALRHPVSNPNEHYYIKVLNAVDCEVSRILNHGSMHQTLVELAREAGFDARKCCDPSLSKEQRKYEPPKGPRQMSSAGIRMRDNLGAFHRGQIDLEGPLNFAAVSEFLLQQNALKEKNEAAAARTTPNSAVARFTGNRGGSDRYGSQPSFGGSRTEPKALAKNAMVNENARLEWSKLSLSIQDSEVAEGLSSERTTGNPTDQAAQLMSNEPVDSKTSFNGFVIPKRQRGGSVQQEGAIPAARPESRSATSTASSGGLSGSQPSLSKQPPVQAPIQTQRTLERQARRESSGVQAGSLPQHGALVRSPSEAKESGLLTPSNLPSQASSSNTQQRGSLPVKTESREQSASLAEHQTASQSVVASTQASTTQGQAITAAMTKKLDATINQNLLEAIRGVYRSVPKLVEGKIRGWLDGPEYRSMGFAVLRDVENETTKMVRNSLIAKMKAMEQIVKGSENSHQAESVRDTKRKADEKDAEGGDQSQQAAKRQRSDGGGSGCTA